MKPSDFAPDARAEFEAAVNWYEAKAAGLGERAGYWLQRKSRLQKVESTSLRRSVFA